METQRWLNIGLEMIKKSQFVTRQGTRSLKKPCFAQKLDEIKGAPASQTSQDVRKRTRALETVSSVTFDPE